MNLPGMLPPRGHRAGREAFGAKGMVAHLPHLRRPNTRQIHRQRGATYLINN